MNKKIEDYKFWVNEKVKFHEVDILGVCNNAVYFNYFEDGRIGYVQKLKEIYKFKEFLVGNSFFIMAHNEIDYYMPAHLDDELKIYTKINFIKKSSFGFEHLVYREKDNSIVAEGKGIVVHIDKSKNKSYPLPGEFYEAVSDFEEEVQIIR